MGEWSNSIAPKQTVAIKDGEFTLEFSLLSALFGKGKVKAYLKNRPSTTVRDMDEFYSFIGKKRRKTKRYPRSSSGPLNPYSGMDPDIRAEIEKGDHGEEWRQYSRDTPLCPQTPVPIPFGVRVRNLGTQASY